ncbi:hypothetical protein [Aliamphritea spongicola]|nr:hypothetical protein [Aliamphritea spongicola]
MTIVADQLDAFQSAFDAEVRRQMSAEQLQHSVLTDGALSGQDFTLQVAELLREGDPGDSISRSLYLMVSFL